MATRLAPAPGESLYERDGYAWSLDQGACIRARALGGIDWDNVAEEIETVGRNERGEIERRLDVIVEHLIKLAVSADRDPRAGWWETIETQRVRVLRKLKQNPSLRPLMAEMFAEAWPVGARDARRGLRQDEAGAIPAVPFLTVDQAMTIETDIALSALTNP